jgi:hypothetical protein
MHVFPPLMLQLNEDTLVSVGSQSGLESKKSRYLAGVKEVGYSGTNS